MIPHYPEPPIDDPSIGDNIESEERQIEKINSWIPQSLLKRIENLIEQGERKEVIQYLKSNYYDFKDALQFFLDDPMDADWHWNSSYGPTKQMVEWYLENTDKFIIEFYTDYLGGV